MLRSDMRIFYIILLCCLMPVGCFNYEEQVVTYTKNVRSFDDFLAENTLPYILPQEKKAFILSALSDIANSESDGTLPNKTEIEAIIGLPDIENVNRNKYKGVITESRNCIYILYIYNHEFSTSSSVSIEYDMDGFCQNIQHWEQEVLKKMWKF